jgi:hypothetical protein
MRKPALAASAAVAILWAGLCWPTSADAIGLPASGRALAVIDTTRLVHDFACVYPDWYPRRWAVFARRACYLYFPGYFSYRPYGYYGFARRHHRVPR